MVYCSKCGEKNDETALHCVKCGAKLDGSTKSWDQRLEEDAEQFGKRMEEWGENFGKQFEEGECFRPHHAGLAFGLFIGIVIILVGIFTLIGIEFWSSFWAVAMIVFGLLIFGGTLYSLIRRH